MEKDQEFIRDNSELDKQANYLRETEDNIEQNKANLKNKEDEIILTLIIDKVNISKMQKNVKLIYNIVVDERVKMSIKMKALNKAGEGLRNCASKLKSKKDKLHHTFQIDPDISDDKNINGLVVQLEGP